jgi:hypothetical protein
MMGFRSHPVVRQHVAHEQHIGGIVLQMQDAKALAHLHKISEKPAIFTPPKYIVIQKQPATQK